MREKEKNMAKKNYYAVKQGKVPGIYRTWDACKAQVHGYPGAIYKGFERLEAVSYTHLTLPTNSRV